MIGTLVGIRYEVLSEQEPSPLFVSYRALDRQTGKDVRLRLLEPNYTKEPKFVAAIKDHVGRLMSIVHPALEKFTNIVATDVSPL